MRTNFTYNVYSKGWFCIIDCIRYILYLMALHALCFKSDALSLIKILLLFFFLCLSIQESSKMLLASSRS